MFSKDVRLKLVLFSALTFILLPAFADTNSAKDAVKQQIVVEPVPDLSDDFMRGVDVSMIDQIEKSGGKFYNADGKEEDVFKILKDHGVNWIRIRLWNNPTYEEDQYDSNGKLIAKKGTLMGGGNNNLETDLRIAKRVKDAGLKFLLDFHYSDFWADPGKQYMSQDWKNLSEKELNVAVEKFTKETIEAFQKIGAGPDMVQIGNELDSGFMWPAGQLWSNDPTVKIGGFKGFTTLLASASRGVRSAAGGKDIKIVIHVADGGNNDKYRWIFDEVKKAKIDYDVIGLSFYPYWHGSFKSLKNNMTDLSRRYGKEMIVAETAYAFTTEDGDAQGNVFQIYSDEENGYVPGVQGQATEVRDTIATVASVKGGVGVFYWEADSILVPGAHLSATEGNTWENQAMFDFEGRALPSLAVWNLAGGKGEITNAWGGSAKLAKDFIPYKVAEPVEVSVKPGAVPELPTRVKLVFTDDSERLVDVEWDRYDWKAQKNIGKVNVSGLARAYGFKLNATVDVTNRVNLIADPSFESGKFGSWKFNGPGAACFVENNKSNAHTGKWTYKYWLGSGFKSLLTQTFNGIEDGTYELSVWAMGGGGENTIRLFASDFDGSKKQISVKIENTGWQVWKQYKLLVPVTGGKAAVGIYLDTKPECWGNFDDVVFEKVQTAYTAQEDDGFTVALDEDLTNAVAAQSGPAQTGSASSVKQGIWIETTGSNKSLIRDIATGKKKGYEFDNSHFISEANWWFWGDISKNFHLDATVSIWEFDKTLYQANTYASNVPDVTWGDGLQSLASMPFSFIYNMNDNGVAMFDKIGFTIINPYVELKLGYGDLKASGMSDFDGIFHVIDRWDYVDKGFTELSLGKSLQNHGSVTINATAALSMMRGTYGTYDILDIKTGNERNPVFEGALTFGSYTNSEELFRYNEQNINAASAYLALAPKDFVKLELHGLSTFGTDVELDKDAVAAGARVSLSGQKWNLKVSDTFAGKNVNSVWGSDGTDYDDINANTMTAQLDADLSAGESVTVGLDQGMSMILEDEESAFKHNQYNGYISFRCQPYADIDLGSLLNKDISLGLYGVARFDKLSDQTKTDKPLETVFSEAGIEIRFEEAIPGIKKLTFDYGIKANTEWEMESSKINANTNYNIGEMFHSVMVQAQVSDALSFTAGALYRDYAGELKSDFVQQSLGFAAGFMIKKTPLPGHPHFWVHATYGMDPYEDLNYELFRADSPTNKPMHRTYLLNNLDDTTGDANTSSYVRFGLIWDLQ